MNEDKARRELDRANRARLILESKLFTEAVDEIRETLLKSFTESRLDDDDTRRNARIGIGLLDKIVSNIKRHMETGKLAEKQIAEIEKRRQ